MDIVFLKMKFMRLSVFYLQLIVYIHRQASIVETSQCGMPRQEMPVCRFTFNSLAEVRAFWTTLQRESFNTAAGLFLIMFVAATTIYN